MNFSRTYTFVIIFVVYVLSVTYTWAESVTVLYPDVKPPYDKIFSTINKGIESESQFDIKFLPLPNKFNPTDIASQINSDKVIALGRRGFAVAKKLYHKIPVVVGALPIKPNGISGVSLMASPDILFTNLKMLAPNITEVTVVYTDASKWIMEHAALTAKNHGITLHAIAVNNIKNAVQQYEKLFENKSLKNHAIWLPLDPVTANDKIIVPKILERAWLNKMVVFSSKPTHAKRGALFSAMPDNLELGKQLVKLVQNIEPQNQPATTLSIVKPMDKIELAVNLRTAAHLGYEYNQNKRSGFALTFPQK